MAAASSNSSLSKRRLRTRCLALFIGSASWLAASPASAQTFTQPQVSEALSQSLDIMKDHVRFLGIQDQYDSALAYYSLTYRVAPVRIAIHDGRTPRTALMRLGQSVGVGIGNVSNYTLFGGAWVDIAGSSVPGTDVSGVAADGLLFLGAGAKGFQFTYSSLQRQRLKGDLFGNYPSSDKYILDPSMVDDRVVRRNQAFSAYHTSGASLIVVRTMGENGWELGEVRAQFQPLKPWLSEVAGLPMIAIQRLNRFQSYYGDLKNAYTRGVDPLSADLSATSQNQSTPYEIELGSDDLLGIGIRAHVLTRVSPDVAFRRGELGWYGDSGPFTFAGLFTTYMRNGELQLSGDAFARFALGHPTRRKVGWPVSFGISYSYNSPDTATFLPLPYAHVFGFQLTVGVPDIGKALVPIVRPTK